MTLLRILLYMLGSWLGGVFVTFLGVAAFAGSWVLAALFGAVSLALAGGLASALRGDARVGAGRW